MMNRRALLGFLGLVLIGLWIVRCGVSKDASPQSEHSIIHPHESSIPSTAPAKVMARESDESSSNSRGAVASALSHTLLIEDQWHVPVADATVRLDFWSAGGGSLQFQGVTGSDGKIAITPRGPETANSDPGLRASVRVEHPNFEDSLEEFVWPRAEGRTEVVSLSGWVRFEVPIRFSEDHHLEPRDLTVRPVGTTAAALIVESKSLQRGQLILRTLDSALPVTVRVVVPGGVASAFELPMPSCSADRYVVLDPITIEMLSTGSSARVRLVDGPLLEEMDFVLKSEATNRWVTVLTDAEGVIQLPDSLGAELRLFPTSWSLGVPGTDLKRSANGLEFAIPAAMLTIEYHGLIEPHEIQLALETAAGTGGSRDGEGPWTLWDRVESGSQGTSVLVRPGVGFRVMAAELLHTSDGAGLLGSLSIAPMSSGTRETRLLELRSTQTVEVVVPMHDGRRESSYRATDLERHIQAHMRDGEIQLLTGVPQRFLPGRYRLLFFPLDDVELVPIEPFLDVDVVPGMNAEVRPRLAEPARLLVTINCSQVVHDHRGHALSLVAQVRESGFPIPLRWTSLDEPTQKDEGRGVRCGGRFLSSCLPPVACLLRSSRTGQDTYREYPFTAAAGTTIALEIHCGE